MNIKSKLIEQLAVLENLQLLATNSGAFDTALSISNMILTYIIQIDVHSEEEDYICPDCEEALAKEMLHQEIADTCDLPIELVNRVMAGQDEVLNGE